MVNPNGSFNGWCGTCAEMTDDDGDNIYELTIEPCPREPSNTSSLWTAGQRRGIRWRRACTLTTGGT